MSLLLYQLFKFVIIGSLNTLISFLMYNYLIHILPISIAYCIAYLSGTITSLILNASWTFNILKINIKVITKLIIGNIFHTYSWRIAIIFGYYKFRGLTNICSISYDSTNYYIKLLN